MPARAFNLHAGPGLPDDPDELHNKPSLNFGLAYEKFFGQWAANNRVTLFEPQIDRRKTTPLHEWIEPGAVRKSGQPISKTVGNADLIKGALDRRITMAQALDGIIFKMRLVSRLVIGHGSPSVAENAGLTWHHLIGAPYLPASGLKQVTQKWAEAGESKCGTPDEETRQRIFGSLKTGAGSVIFLDGLPGEPVKVVPDIVNPHYRPYYDENPNTQDPKAPGDWFAPVPISFPVVDAGAVYSFALFPRAGRGALSDTVFGDLACAFCWLSEGLAIMGAGAMTGVGYGHFDFTKSQARTAWRPKANEVVSYAGMRVRVHTIRGDFAAVVYLDEDGKEDVPVSDLSPYGGR